MKRCDLVPTPFKNLHIPDCPPCMQITYETLVLNMQNPNNTEISQGIFGSVDSKQQ